MERKNNKQNILSNVIAIENNKGIKSYSILLSTITNNKEVNGLSEWKHSVINVSQTALDSNADNIREKLLGTYMHNFILSRNGKDIEGRAASLDRFETSGIWHKKQFVILSKIAEEKSGRILGYRVITGERKVMRLVEGELIRLCREMIQMGVKYPIQNAMFVEDKSKKDHIREYSSEKAPRILIEYVSREPKENTYKTNKENEKVEDNNNNTKEVNGANEKLSAEQMAVLKEGTQKGLSERQINKIAKKEFSTECMKFYICDMLNGMDIDDYLDSRYKIEQLSVLSLAKLYGLDITLIANPRIDAQEMNEIYVRLSEDMWKTEIIG